jgi:hypothetical protein
MKERLKRKIFTLDQKEVTCLNAEPLPDNDIGPPLEKGKKYPLKGIILDKAGNQHLDVGIESKLLYVSSYETGEHLPGGDKIHFCHPSRFE